MKPRFFASPAALRNWFKEHHEGVGELWIGFHRKDSGNGGITYPEALDEALCFGWIDGVRRSVGESAYAIRFTPRKSKSIWSQVNIAKAKVLIARNRMAPAGLAAFTRRDADRTTLYSYERQTAAFDHAHEKMLRANAQAWKFWSSQPPWYRRTATHWIVSAKKEATRARRFATLLEHSAKQRPIPPLARPTKR